MFLLFLQQNLSPATYGKGQGEVPLWSKILICDKYGLTYLETVLN